ncbi:MAG TPA: hypothetical protein VGX37_03210 [Allosphingosinicella sp.]|nr:hypothetical protein [Allosphingosinicella sp.]
MLLMILMAALPAFPMPAAAAPPSRLWAETSPKCPEARVQMTAQRVPLVPRRLDELPPGRLELTVLREVHGCPIPAVLRDGLGGRR